MLLLYTISLVCCAYSILCWVEAAIPLTVTKKTSTAPPVTELPSPPSDGKHKIIIYKFYINITYKYRHIPIYYVHVLMSSYITISLIILIK